MKKVHSIHVFKEDICKWLSLKNNKAATSLLVFGF